MGITGQLLMTSDDMPALPEDRVELLRASSPWPTSGPWNSMGLCGWPRIFDSRVFSPGAGRWDVVAIFNRDTVGPFRSASTPRNSAGPRGNRSSITTSGGSGCWAWAATG